VQQAYELGMNALNLSASGLKPLAMARAMDTLRLTRAELETVQALLECGQHRNASTGSGTRSH
jgi:hypothetical protein